MVSEERGEVHHITASAIHDISSADTISPKTIRVFWTDTGDVGLDNTIVANILRHDGRNAIRYVVRSMKLTAKWSCLNCPTLSYACISKSGNHPVQRQ